MWQVVIEDFLLTHLILMTTLLARYIYHHHFEDVEVELQGDGPTTQGHTTSKLVVWAFNPRQSVANAQR